MRTSLTDIPGVGEQTAQKLLRRFGSVARLRELTLDELSAELPRSRAERVFAALREAEPAGPKIEL